MSADPRSRFGELLAEFAKGWEKGRAEQIVGVFSTDAVFLPSPFDPPARGHDGIRAYWRDLPMEQAEVSFRHGEIFVAGPWFATEFKCTFRRRRTGEPVDLRGALFCETGDDLITEMRMYWHRVVTKPA